MKTGKLFLIVGPSGVGKGTLINLIRERNSGFYFPSSVTTRSPRGGEENGFTYKFVSHDKFEELIAKNELLEWAVVHDTQKYGTLKKPILDAIQAGKVVIREVDIQGLISIREKLPHEIFTAIFIAPPDLATLKQRILQREQISNEELACRLASAEKELSQKNLANYEVVSREGEIEKLYEDVLGIIKSVTRGSPRFGEADA